MGRFAKQIILQLGMAAAIGVIWVEATLFLRRRRQNVPGWQVTIDGDQVMALDASESRTIESNFQGSDPFECNLRVDTHQRSIAIELR